MTGPMLLRVREVRLYERALRLRLPFRYGVVTLRDAVQGFARVRVESAAGSAWGAAAEILAPKWFDKDPALDDAANVEQLRLALALAAPCYAEAGRASAFTLSHSARAHAVAAGGARGLPPLAAGFGPALIDRAVLDAACRVAGVDFFAAMRANLPGIDAAAGAPDLAGFDAGAFLHALTPLRAIEARHTVGLLDALEAHDAAPDDPGDGLPVTLHDAIRAYGHRWFKVKLGGDVDADLARVAAVARVLDRACPERYRVTLDGNERYHDPGEPAELMRRIAAHPALARFHGAIALLEQPLDRRTTLDADVTALAREVALMIDESDDAPDAFVRARALGYTAVSSKSCKGLYKSTLNAARCAHWNARAGAAKFFLSAEDLTCQGGLAVQQDLALAALLGIAHAERNGHHFAGPMPGAPPAEHAAFLAAHPDLYAAHGGAARLRIEHGRIALGSLACPGFAHAAEPDWAGMTAMALPA